MVRAVEKGAAGRQPRGPAVQKASAEVPKGIKNIVNKEIVSLKLTSREPLTTFRGARESLNGPDSQS